MKKRSKFFAVAGAIVFTASFAMGACGTESDAKGTFDDYTYDYNQTTLKAYPDENMTVDGVLEEDKWSSPELKWLENYDQESEVYFKFTMFFSEKGLYFGAVSKDWHVYYNKPYSQTLNTGFNVYIAKVGDFTLDERVYISFNCGNTHWSHGLNTYEGVVTVQGEGYNTGKSEGITLEAFVPWSQFGYTEAPEEMRAVCSYTLVSAAGTTTAGSNLWTGYVNGGDYAKYYDFNANGWESADVETGILGDSKSGYAKGPDWDMSQAADDVYSSNKAQQHIKATGQTYLYFKDVWSDSYTVSATVTPNVRSDDGKCGLNNENPRAGIMTGYNEYCFSALMVNFSKSNLDSNTLELSSSFTQSGSTTHTVIYKSKAGEYDVKQGVTLTCVKSGSSFFYYIGEGDDVELIYMEEISLLKGKAEPGIQTTSCDVTVTNPKVAYKEGGSEMMGYLNRTGVYVLETENGAGGSVTADVYSVKRGDSLTLNVLPTSGFYKLAKFEISYGGDFSDITETVRANMNGGKYVLSDVQSNITVRSVFERCDDSEVSRITGSVVSQSNGIPVSGAVIAVEGKTDKSQYYTATTNNNGIYSARLPKGEYNVTVMAGGYEKAVTKNVTVNENGATLDKSLTLALVGGSVSVNGKTLASSLTRCTFSMEDSASVVYAQSGTDQEVAWLGRLGAVSGDFTVTAVYEYLGGSDGDPSGGFVVSNGSDKFALFALGNNAGYGSGFRYYNTSVFANRWQNRTKTPQITFTTDTKVIMTLKRVDGVYYLYSDMYTEGMTEAATLRGQVTGGVENNVTTGTGKLTIPAGNIAVGVSFRNDSACKITVLSAQQF